MRLLPMLLISCSEYEINEELPDELPGDTAPVTVETGEPEVAEDCTVELPEAGTVEPLEECIAPRLQVVEPWSAELEWQWTGGEGAPEVREVIAMPAIGNLTDDDGDGLVTAVDVPDVVFIAGNSSSAALGADRLVVLDGKTGEEHWSLPGFYWLAGVTLADVDADGEIEIVAVDQSRRPVVVSATGAIEWTAPVALTTDEDAQQYPGMMVADLWGDGSPEVIADVYILSGTTGEVLTELSRDPEIRYTLPTIGDIDRDGLQEIILGSRCFSPDGTLEWSSPIVGNYGQWSAIVNVDDDDGGEVVMIGAGLMAIYDDDGTELMQVEVESDQPGPPCMADFDGDSTPELAWPNATSLRVYELDGTEVWSRSIIDASGLAGCSAYDVNGDGAYEVLYADEQNFTIYDGLSGENRYTYDEHTSGTVWEYPVVADIDGDLSAEIVFASNDSFGIGGFTGITALGHPEGAWLASGPTWHVHDFAVTNISPDGTVPVDPEPSWLAYNIYRARPAMDRDMGMDLVSEIIDVCFEGCDPEDTVRVSVQIANQGVWPVLAGVPVSVFSRDGDSLSFVGLTYTDAPLPPGGSSAGLELELRVADIGADGLTARADELGAGFGIVDECDETNNAGEWSGLCDAR